MGKNGILAVIVIVLAAAVGASWFLLNNKSHGATAPVYRLAVHVGDELSYNMTVKVYIDGSLNKTASDVVRVRVASFEPPLIELNFTDSGGRPARVPYGVIAIPLSHAGMESISVPVAAGYTWTCLTLQMTGYSEGPLGRTVVYRGSIVEPNLTLTAVMAADRGTGVVVEFRVNMTVSTWGGGRVTALLLQELTEYKPFHGGELEARAPEGFTCGNGFSRDLRFTIEGLYRVEGGAARPVGLGEIQEASGGAVLAVVNKRDPASMSLWESLLNASRKPGVRVYVLVYDSSSRLFTPDMAYVTANIVKPVLNSMENPRLPLLIRLGSGGVEGVEAGPLTYEEVQSFLGGG